MSESIRYNSPIDLRLPLTPEASDAESYKQLAIVYNALRQLQLGVDIFLDIPPQLKDAPHTLTVLDRGQSVDTDSDVTVPLEADEPFSYGTVIVVTNISAAAIVLAGVAGVSLITAGTVTIGNKTLANFGVATLRYLGNDTWIVLGTGVR